MRGGLAAPAPGVCRSATHPLAWRGQARGKQCLLSVNVLVVPGMHTQPSTCSALTAWREREWPVTYSFMIALMCKHQRRIEGSPDIHVTGQVILQCQRRKACRHRRRFADSFPKTQVKSARNATKRLETWRVLESFYKSGRCRAIGVSNYEQHHLQELLDCAAVKPMVNQVSSLCSFADAFTS